MLLLKDYSLPIFYVTCRPCERRGEYVTSRLIERYGSETPVGKVITDVSKDCKNRRCVAGCEEIPLVRQATPMSDISYQAVLKRMNERLAERAAVRASRAED